MFLCQQTQNGILRKVCVLKFVHQNMFKLLSVCVAYDRIVLEDPVGIDEHVVKIHGIIFNQPLLIEDEKTLDLFITEVPDRVGIWLDQIVLGTRDGIQQGCRAV